MAYPIPGGVSPYHRKNTCLEDAAHKADQAKERMTSSDIAGAKELLQDAIADLDQAQFWWDYATQFKDQWRKVGIWVSRKTKP